MEYEWQIRVKNKGVSLTIIGTELRKYLSLRGYIRSEINFTSQECTLTIENDKDKKQYHIVNIKEEANKDYNLKIDITLGHGEVNDHLMRKDVIVFLIEDYFKVHTIFYFFIETLSKHEINLIENGKREIHPKRIYDRLKANPVSLQTKTPNKIYQIGKHGCTIFYFGNKEEFGDIINFWISFKTWVFMDDEFEFNNMNLLAKLNYVHLDLGKCIPLKNDSKTIKAIISIIEKSDALDNKLFEFKRVYKMGFEWDNRIVIFDNIDTYFIYNWWTMQ